MNLSSDIPAPELYLGLATPQANPTVEAEFRMLVRGSLLPVFTRLVSRAQDPEDRLREYFTQAGTSIESFDTLPLAAFGFACTGSSYLIGARAEDAAVQGLAHRFAMPVVTATAAIRAELAIRRARRIAIVAPYPVSLCDAARRYWESVGYEVATLQRLETGCDDTRSIYHLTAAVVADALRHFDPAGADAVLLSGTGMPSLAAIAQHTEAPPMISSNVCLAAQMLRRTGEWPRDRAADITALLGEY